MSNAEFREDEPFTRRATGPFESWRRHWVLGTLVTVLFGAAGAAAGFLMPVTWTAEARVAVGSGDLTSGAIAGFPLAASQLASNYARYVNDSGVAGNPVPENVELSASQIPDSNVIRIEAKSADPEAARAAANETAQQLMDAVNSNGDEQLTQVYDAFTEAAQDDAAAESDLAAAQHTLDRLLAADASNARIRDARDEVTEASAKAARTGLLSDSLRQKYTAMVANTSTAAQLKLARTADSLASNRNSLVTRYGLLGLAGGAVISLLLVVALDRRRVAEAQPEPARAEPGVDDRPVG
ncbi:MAG: hypothetical protein IT193_09095 [Propionibacteriaceae bacterium]|nr:hypothetical protein [Propionibacteriaceae bacterium]